MPPGRAYLIVVLIISAALLSVRIASAQIPSTLLGQQKAATPAQSLSTKQGESDIGDLNKLKADALSEINRIDKSPGRQGNAPEGTPQIELDQYYRLLKSLALFYQQHINAITEREEEERRIKQFQTRKQFNPSLSDTQNFSVLRLDNLRAELQTQLLARRSLDAQVKINEVQTEGLQSRLDTARAQERKALETLEKDSKLKTVDRDKWLYHLKAIESRTIGVLIDKLGAELKILQMRRSSADLEIGLSRQQLKAVEAKVSFSESDMRSIRDRIAERKENLLMQLEMYSTERDASTKSVARQRIRLDSISQQLEELRLALNAAKEELSTAESTLKTEEEKSDSFLQKINPVSAIAKSKASENLKRAKEKIAQLNVRIAAKRVEQKAADYEIKLGETRVTNAMAAFGMASNLLVALDIQLAFWENRFTATGEGRHSKADLRRVNEHGNLLLERLEPVVLHLQSQLGLTIDLNNQQEQAKLGATDPLELKFIQQVLVLLQERQQTYLKALSQADELRQLLLRWREESESADQSQNAGKKLDKLLQSTLYWLTLSWNYELIAVEDTIEVDGRTISGKRGITVAKIIQALAIIIIGWLLVVRISYLVLSHAVRRLKIDVTQANIARKWIVSILGIVLLLISLAVVKIPLTIFAFLGGAIAIGAGFGMQTLFKNLMSGVMLLIERPFRPGDVVEVGSIRGDIVDINVRSCTIRDVNGIETLIPNSTFIEQNVTNWTLSNRTVRFSIKVGVSYGAPLQAAIDLMLELADKHPNVMRFPSPEVLLEDFGDNAQMLALYVWIEISASSQPTRKTLSELRLSIANSFAERNINIAFPQRDIHLDTPQPIRIEMVQAAS